MYVFFGVGQIFYYSIKHMQLQGILHKKVERTYKSKIQIIF